MFSPETPRFFLAALARRSASTWLTLGLSSFPGELSMATMSGVYRFNNGLFLGRARLGARSFEWSKALRGSRLIGFLTDESGSWSLSPHWLEGAHAVLWKPDATDDERFIITSPTTSFTLEEAVLPADPGTIAAPSHEAPPPSRVRARRMTRPPSFRRPLPDSTTRIHPAPSGESTR